MEITEKDFFNYLKCPVLYQLSKSEFFEEDIRTYKDYVQLSLNAFYTAIKYKKPDYKLLESKLESLFRADDVDRNTHMIYLSKSMLVKIYEYFRNNNIRFLDTNTPYNIEIDGSGVALKGIINPLIQCANNTIEILVFDLNKKVTKKEDLELRTKLTLDAYVTNKMFNQDIVIKVYNVYNNVETIIIKGKKDYRRFEGMLRNVNKAISNNIIFPRETYMCNGCHIKYMCKSWTIEE